MEGTRTRGRQSATMIDWMKSNDVEYDHIKKRANDREDWRHWRPGPAWKGRAHKKSNVQSLIIYSQMLSAVHGETDRRQSCFSLELSYPNIQIQHCSL